jgi:hypothetical protein
MAEEEYYDIYYYSRVQFAAAPVVGGLMRVGWLAGFLYAVSENR